MSRSARSQAARAPASTPARAGAPDAPGPGVWLALALAFVGAALWIYAPAFPGPFVSDDLHYVRDNPYVHELSWESLKEILDPAGPLPVLVENYAPVHVLLHALEWQVFGSDVRGYHVVNAVAHALSALLLVAWLRRLALPFAAAAAGGAVFLVHPANVEAVAWISQLKTTSCMVLSLLALLAFRRRPALATGLFALALLAKATAAFALAVLVVEQWVRWRSARRGGDEAAAPARRELAWLGAWAAVFAVFAVVELGAFRAAAGSAPVAYPDPWDRARTAAVIALRYLIMAAAGRGISAFHEPEPVTSWADAELWAALAVLAAIGARAAWVLWQGRLEAVAWTWALASWAPISQIFPFPFPMANRYLYFILPGLIGAGLCMGRDALAWVQRRWPDGSEALSRAVPVAGGALAVVLAVTFALQAHARARMWASPQRLLAEAAANYPHGSSAAMQEARRAAMVGDAETAIRALRRLQARGWNRFDQLYTDPAYAPIRNTPAFQELVREMATWWIARLEQREDPSQMELQLLSWAYQLRGEDEAALRALERAAERGGPRDEKVRQELEELRARVARRSRGG